MSWPVSYQIKHLLRICDCLLTRRTKSIRFRNHAYQFYTTYWWGNVSQPLFDDEIAPYFEFLEENFRPSVVLDVGAAAGHFAIPAGKIFPESRIYAFEPAMRQRILLSRNAKLNRVQNCTVEPTGLWSRSEVLPFRTVGAESSFAPVSRFQGVLPFPETVPVKALDQWVAEEEIKTVDLIKVDAEGAEMQILEGAQETLARFHPRLLVQAYHLVEGSRTFERCARLLETYGYHIREPHPGLLYGL